MKLALTRSTSFFLSIITFLAIYILLFDQSPSYHQNNRQFLFVANHRHHLTNVVRQLQRRGLTEHLLPQTQPELLWQQVSVLLPKQWNVIWSFNAVKFSHLPALASYHRINHIPGNEQIVIKSDLWSTHNKVMAAGKLTQPFMPRHFMLPTDINVLEKAWKENRWVAKSTNHRGVHIIKQYEDVHNLPPNTMVAQYIEPLLVDQRKWDVGIYIAITSLDPLTIFIYDATTLLRFCKIEYPKDGILDMNTPLDAYVVNKYKPPWELPSLISKYKQGGIPSEINEGESSWTILLNHLKLTHDVKKVNQMTLDIQNSIVATIQEIIPTMRSKVEALGGWSNTFFELYRWDFIVSDDLKIYLTECNMSPNLMPKKFETGSDGYMKRQLTKHVLDMVKSGGKYSDLLLDTVSKYESQTIEYVPTEMKIKTIQLCSSNKCDGCSSTRDGSNGNKDGLTYCFQCLKYCFAHAPMDIKKSMKELLYSVVGSGGFELLIDGFSGGGNEKTKKEKAAIYMFGGGDVGVVLPLYYYQRESIIETSIDAKGKETKNEKKKKMSKNGPIVSVGQKNGTHLSSIWKFGIAVTFVLSVWWCYKEIRTRRSNGVLLPVRNR